MIEIFEATRCAFTPPLPLGPAGGPSQCHVSGSGHAPLNVGQVVVGHEINFTVEVQCGHSRPELYTRALRVAVEISLLVIETPGEASVLKRNGIGEYLYSARLHYCNRVIQIKI